LKLAAIDIGSNAMRLLISRVLPDMGNGVQFKKVEFIRIPVRLGDDAFRHQMISPEKAELFMKAMQAYKLIMEIHDVKDFKACATSAMREAENGPELVKRVKDELGIDIEIVSGNLESGLILKSVLNYFPEDSDYLLIDVGGGSTEMTIIKNHMPILSKSFDLGTVRMMDGRSMKKAQKEVEEWVKENTRKLDKLVAVGTGGNINRLHRMAVNDDEKPMSIDKLEKLYEQIKEMTIKDRIYKLKMNPDRADVIEYAAKIYLNIMKWAKIDKIYCPQGGLKDGIISELWEKYSNQPV
jgi:exopolyphosphatase / guanosine-5'-triphosphate,3'-diphosphate pyrophosphatase